jgi:putative oxidoreductase
VDEPTEFDKNRGAILDARSAPEGRGPGRPESTHGVPAVLLPAVIATETLGALGVALGWKTRVVAFLLAGYSLLTALIFHHDFSDQIQMLMFLKNVSIAGGFLLVLVNGAGPISLDARRTSDSSD